MRVIQVSFTTQGLLSKASARDCPATAGRLARVGRVTLFFEAALTSLEFGEARLTALRFESRAVFSSHWRAPLQPKTALGVRMDERSDTMPYALFCNEARLSKTYPTEADVWKLARQSGLVVDAVTGEENRAPRALLDNDYEIRPCRPDPHEDPARNQAEAERDAELEFQLNS